MRPPIDRHEKFRELVSDRLDGGLDPASEQRLERHLADCPRCRMAEREYLRERALLRGLRDLPAPRDLWARTAAALDREIARHPRRRSRRQRQDGLSPQRSPALMVTALGSFVAALAVVGTQLGTVTPPSEIARDPDVVPPPTPFDVPTQELAFVEFTAGGLAIYEATVDRACPATAPDCAVITAARQGVVTVPGQLSAGDIDLHVGNGRIAVLTADDDGNDTVSVVFLPRDDVVPGVGPVRPSIAPTASVAPPSGEDGPPTDPTSSTTPPADPPLSSEPPSESVSPTASEDPAPGDATGRPPSASASSAATATPDMAAPVQAVLEDVHVVGAPPSWSADGEQLAFSAMPADRSHGPDVYTWRIGDLAARRLTNDHRSYFASWSGDRLVVSRASRLEGRGAPQAVAPGTYLIDPASGKERLAVGMDGAWLPSVDPTGRFAVAWVGELELSGRTVSAAGGELFLVDWRDIDPFRTEADGGGAPKTPQATRDGDGLSRPDGRSGNRRGEPDATATPAPDAPSGPGTGESAAPDESPDGPPTSSEPTTMPIGEALEPDRNTRVHPIREWRVSWSEDGAAVGFWVSESTGETWGQLAVYGVDASEANAQRGDPVLRPTLARRGFTLGRERVVWIAPSDEVAEGELRLLTWGSRGYGNLRIREIDVSTGLPAF